MGKVPFSRADFALLRLDSPNNPMVVTALMTFESRLDLDCLKDTITRTLLRHDRFRQRVSLPQFPWERAYWEDDPDFKLNRHILPIRTPIPAEPQLLHEVVSRLMSEKLSLQLPLWRIYLVERYGKGSALIARMHHAIADGQSLVQLLLSTTQTETTEISGNIQPVAHSDQASAKEIPTNPINILEERTRLGVSALTALKELVFSKPDPPNPFKGNVSSKKLALWSEPLNLSEVKLISKVLGCTINDLILSGVTGALRRYALEHDPAGEHTRLHSFVPVDLRRQERLVTGLLDEPQTEMHGNQFGFALFPIPISIADPVGRLEAVRSNMDLLKASGEALVSYWILNLMGALPGNIEDLAARFWLSKGSTVITNVIGPWQKISLGGAPIHTLLGWVPQSGKVGLGISIFSYNNNLCLGIAVDQNLIPDPQRIIALFIDEFESLKSIAQQMHEQIQKTASIPEMLVQMDEAIRLIDEQHAALNDEKPSSTRRESG